MKSIAQMAKDNDISSSTIREYISRFEEFFPDPVEREGIKEFPEDAEDLVKKIYGYYQNSGMTKQEIRVKLGGPAPPDPLTIGGAASMSPMDMEMFKEMTAKFDLMIEAIQDLTSAITGADIDTFKGIRKQTGSNTKINELNDQLTEVIELTKDEDSENVEKNVLDADGTIVFSFGKLSTAALDSINFAKAHKKPWIHIDLETEKNPSRVIRKWLPKFEIKVLNVAGRSASKIPGLKRSINDIISLVLNE